MVGGISGLIGAILLGPRIGKYGKDGNSRAILGHNIPIAALGTFILWFCWYGFNGAAASDPAQLAQILGQHHHRPGGGYRGVHALYLDQKREAGRGYVPERAFGGAGGHHRRLR